MDLLERLNSLLNRGFAVVAGIALVVMMLVTVADMVLRQLGSPLPGTFEMVGWLAAVTTAFALGYAQLHRSHVAITLLTDRLRPRARRPVVAAADLVSAALFALVAWRVFLYAGTLRASGSLSETMKVIVYPWVYLVALGTVGLTVALLVDFLGEARGRPIREPDIADEPEEAPPA